MLTNSLAGLWAAIEESPNDDLIRELGLGAALLLILTPPAPEKT